MKTLQQQLTDIFSTAFAHAGFGREAGQVRLADRPDLAQFQCNGALAVAKRAGKNPREVAEAIVASVDDPQIRELSIAGPGFINIHVSDTALQENAQVAIDAQPRTHDGEVVVLEYSDPNPFKVLHAGHLYTSIVGNTMGRLLERGGADVHHVNFGGDVGLHVGKTMWAIVKELGGENPEKLADIPEQERSPWLSARYVEGNNAYEDDESLQVEIKAFNKRVYGLHAEDDRDSPFAQIYWTTRQWSYDYFDAFYDRIGTPFEKYYPESEVAAPGLKIVREQLKDGVFEESDGAVVFDGEKQGLHTRVFINSQGLPTYEAKDVGLSFMKKEEYDFDRSIIITGKEQASYMQVVLKAIEQFAPDLADATEHYTHGLVKLAGGEKMSSRKGNILKAVDIIKAASVSAEKAVESAEDNIVLGALRYAFLRSSLGPDILYDPEESVSLEGNSGPYLQYAHARARRILEKATVSEEVVGELDERERSLALQLTQYPTVVGIAIEKLEPHGVCTYLYELAQTFNSFYEHSRVVGDDREGVRAQLVEQYADILRDGLGLLNIAAPQSV
jgi:arginyl-tRNA synthetase